MCMAIWNLTKEVLVCGVVSVMETVRFDYSTYLFKIFKFAFKLSFMQVLKYSVASGSVQKSLRRSPCASCSERVHCSFNFML